MDIETIRSICTGFPGVTEDIKWGSDLCFMIGGKMFCVVSLNIPLKVSLKVAVEEFEELVSHPAIIPAPFVARYQWIMVEDLVVFDDNDWKYYITQSFNMVKEKLPKNKLAELK